MTIVRKAAGNGAPRETNVSRIGDARRCLQGYRSKAVGMRAPLTVFSVRGDVAHKLVAGYSREAAEAFLASRLHRQTPELREAILQQAERMAANVTGTAGAAPATSEQHFEWPFQGWLIHSQPDRNRIVWEPNPSGRGKREVLHVLDWKSTRTVKDEHWDALMLHALVTAEYLKWEGPVRMVIQPMQGRRGHMNTRRFTDEMRVTTRQRLQSLLIELERLWDLEIARMLKVLRDLELLTPQLEEQAKTDAFGVVVRKEFQPVWQAETVEPDAIFRPKAGAHCAGCRRLSHCPLGTDWVVANLPQRSWPAFLVERLAPADGGSADAPADVSRREPGMLPAPSEPLYVEGDAGELAHLETATA